MLCAKPKRQRRNGRHARWQKSEGCQMLRDANIMRKVPNLQAWRPKNKFSGDEILQLMTEVGEDISQTGSL